MHTIKCNNVYRWTLDWHELTPAEQKELDYVDTEEAQDDFRGFRYKGQIHDLAQFIRTDKDGEFEAWDGIHALSAFSCLLVKLADDKVLVAYAYC